MNATQNFILRVGGYKELARLMGKPVTTVQYWWEQGRIPAYHQADVLACAVEAGIPATPNDLFDLHTPPGADTNHKHRSNKAP